MGMFAKMIFLSCVILTASASWECTRPECQHYNTRSSRGGVRIKCVSCCSWRCPACHGINRHGSPTFNGKSCTVLQVADDGEIRECNAPRPEGTWLSSP